jgi:pimeloyl-ACP methyl ester carboxylesterase
MTAPAVAAFAAAALAGAALLVWLIFRPRRVVAFERGDGPPLLLLPAPEERGAPLFKALRSLAETHRLIALRKGVSARRTAKWMLAHELDAPIVIAHREGCHAALKLAQDGRASGLVLIAPPKLRAPSADVLFPPTVIVSAHADRTAALVAELPTVERIAAPRLGNNPQKKRPDLIAAALARVEAMALSAPS